MAQADLPLQVFIDVDGTILYQPEVDGPEHLEYQQICAGLDPFLAFVIEHCEPYWLTGRARRGVSFHLEQELFPHLPAIASTIRPAHWDGFKFEALDPQRPFVWFDDEPEEEDTAWLATHDLAQSMIKMNRRQPDNPVRMLEVLKKRLGQR